MGVEAYALQAPLEAVSLNPLTLSADWMSCHVVPGDKVEQLLWRLQNGELPATKHPKVVTVMIGTNGAAATSLPFYIPLGVPKVAVIALPSAQKPRYVPYR